MQADSLPSDPPGTSHYMQDLILNAGNVEPRVTQGLCLQRAGMEKVSKIRKQLLWISALAQWAQQCAAP